MKIQSKKKYVGIFQEYFLDENIDEINKVINTVSKGNRLEGNMYTNGNLNREI